MKKNEIIKSTTSITIIILVVYAIAYLLTKNSLISLLCSIVLAKISENIMLKKKWWSSKIIFSYGITGCIILGNYFRLFMSNFDYAEHFGICIFELFILLYAQFYYIKSIEDFRNYDIDNNFLQMFCIGDFKGAYIYSIVLVIEKFIVMYMQSIIFSSYSNFRYLFFDIFASGITAVFLFKILNKLKNINTLFYFYIFMSIVLLPSVFWITIIYSVVFWFKILSW